MKREERAKELSELSGMRKTYGKKKGNEGMIK
jgi:hypothetical protein